MFRRFVCGERVASAVVFAAPLEQARGVKPRKRPAIGKQFVKEVQVWREEWGLERQRCLADSLRAFVDFSSTRRQVPFDSRFKPFDRNENDGVYIIMKYMMQDKLALCHHQQRPVKRLFCNVGLLGPQVTAARWRPNSFANLPANAKLLSRNWERDTTVKNHGLND